MELNTEEIESILREANNSYLNIPGFIAKVTKHRLDVLSITPVNKLVFIQGDLDTGFDHINYRHNYFSLPKIEPNKNDKFVIPSKFDINSKPLLDYVRISDKIYSFGERNIKNKETDSYDTYTCKLEDEGNRIYFLVLYKNTKIVHTLFPIGKDYSELAYTKAPIRILNNNLVSMRFGIPYIDTSKKIKYLIQVDIDAGDSSENVMIIIFDNDKPKNYIQIIKLQLTIRHYDNMIHRMNCYLHSDLSEFENTIRMYEKGKIPSSKQRISLMRAISLFGRSFSSDLLILNLGEVSLNARTRPMRKTLCLTLKQHVRNKRTEK
jgi:hypothetical protein